MADDNHEKDFQGSYFSFELDGVEVAYFTGVSGLSLEYDVINFKQTNGKMANEIKRPGKPKYSEVVFKRGFTADEKRRDFEYYDPITTGDSTLSAVVQSVVAAEVGYHEGAYDYFLQALFVDLANLHGNTVDGLHVASTGGVWAALVNGFGGTPAMELYLMYNSARTILEKQGVTIARSLVGSYVTSLDMAGCSITLVMMDDEMLRLWDTPVHTPGLRWGM